MNVNWKRLPKRLPKPLSIAVLFALLGLLLPAKAQSYPNAALLVDAEWLATKLDDPSVLIVDMRSPTRYAEAHVPGAVNLPVSDIVGTVAGVPFEFDAQVMRDALRRIGLRSDHQVVIYDDLGMMDAARLFWTLEYVGHDDVHVLDGGWNAWQAGGAPVDSGALHPEPSEFELALRSDKLITADELVGRLDDPGLAIADARSREEFSGEFTFSGRAGRIPGAVHLPWFGALTGGDVVPTTERGWQAELSDPDVESMKSAAELRAWLEDAGITRDKEVVTYCQTFWRGAHLYFVLRLMGYENVRGYDGSWAQWSVSDLPIETGQPR